MVWKERVQDHIRFITEGASTMKLNYFKYSVIASISFLLVFGSQIMIYFIVDATFTPDPAWEQRIIAKCPNVRQGGLMLNDLSVAIASLVSFIYTGYLGLLIHRK